MSIATGDPGCQLHISEHAMGEMADFFLGEVEEYEELRFQYRSGEIPLGEAYDLGIIDERGYETGPSTGRSKQTRCKHCGTTQVKWNKFPDGTWRLQNIADRRVHTCSQYKENKN